MIPWMQLIGNILEVSQKLEKGLLSACELCEICLKRANATKDLNAYITLTSDIARKQATATNQRVKEGKRLGILDGIPIAFKDNFNTLGVRTSCASNMLGNYVSPYNATVVQKLLDSGAIMMGKTNMDEFAMGSGTVDSVFGPTKNPWPSILSSKILQQSLLQSRENKLNIMTCEEQLLEEDDFFTCGGSSGGSAVAVATGSCFGALGSDTGGSTRNPAAICGVIGLKPTYGLVSRHGLIPLCNSLDVPGIITRTTDDAALLLGCIAGWDPHDSTTSENRFTQFAIPEDISIKDFHIGIPKEYSCSGISPEIVDLWDDVADLLSSGGARVSRVSLPHTEHSIVCYSVLSCCDIVSNFSRYDGLRFGYRADEENSAEHLFAATRHEGFGQVVRERILTGSYFLLKSNYEKYFIKATQVRHLICEDFQRLFDSGVNFMLTPVTLSDALPYSTWKSKTSRENCAFQDYCTQPANLAGLPAVSVPCKLSAKGFPLSLQLIGRPFEERNMLTVAKWIEQRMKFPFLDLSVNENECSGRSVL